MDHPHIIDTFEEIKTKDGYCRFINHNLGLLTTGFKTIEKLREYKYLIRFNESTRKIMQDRYKVLHSD